MKTKLTLILAAMLAAGSAATQAGAQQVNPRNPSDSRAFDVMETDQGPPTATDRLYAKPKHKKHGKKTQRSADTQQSDMSSSGVSGAQGTTGSGYNQDWNQPNQPNQLNQ
jgi:opacity protein-like surface antigen